MNKIYRVLGKRGRITVPFEIRKSCGFAYNDILSFTEQDNNIVLIKREKICDSCRDIDNPHENKQDTVTLFDFLNGLSEKEQRAALIHLSVNWAEKQGGGNHV